MHCGISFGIPLDLFLLVHFGFFRDIFSGRFVIRLSFYLDSNGILHLFSIFFSTVFSFRSLSLFVFKPSYTSGSDIYRNCYGPDL